MGDLKFFLPSEASWHIMKIMNPVFADVKIEPFMTALCAHHSCDGMFEVVETCWMKGWVIMRAWCMAALSGQSNKKASHSPIAHGTKRRSRLTIRSISVSSWEEKSSSKRKNHSVSMRSCSLQVQKVISQHKTLQVTQRQDSKGRASGRWRGRKKCIRGGETLKR